MAAAVSYRGQATFAASGSTRAEGGRPLPPDARWHIGSNTKAFTAALAGILVQEKRIRWNSTIGEFLGDLDPPASFRPITLWQLLSHTGGVHRTTYPAGRNWWDAKVTRREYVQALLRVPLAHHPGTGFEYSNAGYAIAGHMLERAGKATWESLLERKIFRKLGIRSAGFGAVPSPDGSQPWPHRWQEGKPVPVDPGNGGFAADNAGVVGPAGTMHLGLADHLKFLEAQFEPRRLGLSAANLARLHAPERQRYGGGWIVFRAPWSGGDALGHTGSNTMNVQTVVVAPKHRLAIAVATNDARPGAAQALDEVVMDVVRQLGLLPAPG